MNRLSDASLGALPTSVERPDYDRSELGRGIVHLGVGAFQRAHQAFYVDRLLGNDPQWGIVGASLRRPDTKAALGPQDGLYTLAVRDGSGTRLRVIGSLVELIDANQERGRLIEIMADPAIRIVSLTVTEKGYCHDPATGKLDETHKDVLHDLAHPLDPVSAPGLIIAALAKRRAAGVAPFTIMSCDNLPSNGRTAQRIVTRMAELIDPALGAYVASEVAFAGTMVDRIVPATTEADRAMVAEMLGVTDEWPIVTEPFTQWVIEDNFPSGRPAFETVGAQMVGDVEPFEKMKLRMLNGAHSSLAYLGYLAGFETIAEVMANKDFRDFATGLMNQEVMPTLDMEGVDLGAYRDALIERFGNSALKHRTWQIAMDGSQKLPQRLLGTIRDRLERGEGIARLALGVAGWMVYAAGVDEKGQAIDVRDPFAARFMAIAAEAKGDAAALVGGFLQVGEVFGSDLANNPEFADLLVGHVRRLKEFGALEAVKAAAG